MPKDAIRIVSALSDTNRRCVLFSGHTRTRNGWTDTDPDGNETSADGFAQGIFTAPEVVGILDEVAAKIPAGVTSLTEYGCGTGWFAERLAASGRTDIAYTGVDLSIDQIETAQAAAAGMGFQAGPTFTVGNTWEYAHGTPSSEFIVSIRHCFWDSDARNDQLLLELLFKKTTKGFLIVGQKARIEALKATFLANLASNFTNPGDAYAGEGKSGARAWLTPATLKAPVSADSEKMEVMLYTGDGVTDVLDPPDLYGHLTYIFSGKYNRKIARNKLRENVKKGEVKATEIKGLTFDSKGLVTAVGQKVIATDLKKPLNARELDPKVSLKGQT